MRGYRVTLWGDGEPAWVPCNTRVCLLMVWTAHSRAGGLSCAWGCVQLCARSCHTLAFLQLWGLKLML